MSPVDSGDTVSRVFLVGMMGAGKTTVCRLLAGRLGWPCSDSDELVLASTGHTVAELWRAGGEPAFRREESRALAEALSAPGPAVVAVAGGAVLDDGNRRLLRETGTVVWLRARVETLAERVHGSDGHRPLLAGDPQSTLRRLEAERRPLYAEVADLVVDVDDRGPDQVADEVLASLGRRAVLDGGRS